MSWTRRLGKSIRRARAAGQDEWVRKKLEFIERQNARLLFSTSTYLGDHTAWTWLTSGQRIFVDTRDLGIGQHLMARGFWERSTNEVIRRLVAPTDLVVDVGAHYGYHTLTVAHQAATRGRVIAIEANPRVHSLLVKSVRINQLRNRVRVVHCAVSNREGEVVFVCPNDDPALGHVRAPGEDLQGVHGEAATVPMHTLDAICADEDVAFVKIDVEGHESQVFEGGTKTLGRDGVRMLIEYAPAFIERQQTLEAFHDQLRDLGFAHAYEIRGTDLQAVAYEDLPADRSLRNLVLAKKPI